MKTRFLAKCILTGCGVLHAMTAQAGLNLSDSPMFVTEVVPPNVIISTAYANDYQEVAMMEPPWDHFCTEQGCNYSEWTSLGAVFDVLHSWRVTPWPSTSSCHVSKVCSNQAIYPGDMFSLPGVYELHNPLGYRSIFGVVTQYSQEEPYPLEIATPGGLGLYNEAKEKYVRSDKNFLYFNKGVADSHGYRPWPRLGWVDATVFPTYDATNAQAAYYNPLKQIKLAVDQARMDIAGTGWVRDDDEQAFNLPYLIGQYWRYDSTLGSVWQNAAYVGTKWSAMSDADKVNFAHWFTYWRSSYLATRGMLANLIQELGPDGADILDRFRIGIQHEKAGTLQSAVKRVEPLLGTEADPVAARRTNMRTLMSSLASDIYSWGNQLGNWNHEATTTYFKNHTAYRDNPSDDTSPIRTCRRNYEIIITPDYSKFYTQTGKLANPLVGDQDKSGLGTGADGQPLTYYADNYPDLLGDIGAYGWKTDLYGDSSNDTLLPGKRDEATWQHVVRYVIGPKAKGRIFPSAITSFDQAEAVLKQQGPDTWNGLNNQLYALDAIDDVWHMALNSRGFFFPSDNVHSAVDNLIIAFNDILVRGVSGSSVATNTTSLQTGAQIYQATVEADWKGHLRAYTLSTRQVTIDGATKNVVEVNYGSPIWDLAEIVSSKILNITDTTQRNIISYNGTQGVSFTWNSLGAAKQAVLTSVLPGGVTDAAAYGGKLVEYLRGSGECEDGAATSCTAGGNLVFRRRNLDRSQTGAYNVVSNPNGRNILGDISNSNPWYVSSPRAGISDVDYPGYNEHRISNRTRANMLYVGANDGMVHAVRVDPTKDADGQVINYNNVTELFAYVPSFVLDKLPSLASPLYSHKYSADGSPFSADVYINGAWKTVLAGGVNKGGRGYYLLDITDPENFSTSSVLWEFTESDLHYTFNLPVTYSEGHARVGQARQIVRMNNGEWALVVGNGYAEGVAQACLFVINLSGPGVGGWTQNTNYRKYCVGSTTGYGDGLDTNGLSTPTPYDLNGDGQVDVIYAGDLNGNMWRFDVSGTDPADWGVDYSGEPLFIARNEAGRRQPIVSPPEVTTYSQGGVNGQLVLFATGKYLENSDRTNTDTQSAYGVLDKNDAAFSGITRDVLYEQTFSTSTEGEATIRKQDVKSSITYCAEAALNACDTDKTEAEGKMGWYWDMYDSGERLTGRLNLFSGIVFFNTFYPGLDASGQLDPCQYGGSGWLMGLNAVNGYMENQYPVFDVNQDGVIDNSDVTSAGVKVGAAIGGTTFARESDASKIGVYSPTNLGTADTEGKKMTMRVNVDPNMTGRVSWFELVD